MRSLRAVVGWCALLVACGGDFVPRPGSSSIPRGPAAPIASDSNCSESSQAVGLWAHGCQIRCIPPLQPPILCHVTEAPHVDLRTPPAEDWIAVSVDAATVCPAQQGRAWRIYRIWRDTLRVYENIDMLAGGTWPGRTLDDCAHKPRDADPDFMQHHPEIVLYAVAEMMPRVD